MPYAARVMVASASLSVAMFAVDRSTADSCCGVRTLISWLLKLESSTAVVTENPMTPPNCRSWVIAPTETAIES